jgi:hypothetical protein
MKDSIVKQRKKERFIFRTALSFLKPLLHRNFNQAFDLLFAGEIGHHRSQSPFIIESDNAGGAGR